jgi:hypothetical protein
MKSARIILTPKIMARLQLGKTAVFHVPESVREIHVSVREQDDFPDLDGIFSRIFGRIFKNW